MAKEWNTALRVKNSGLRKVTGKKKSGEGRDYYDYNLLAAVILLTCFGLVMLYSTSSYKAALTYEGNSAYYFTRQAVISIVCFAALLFFSQFDYHIYARFSYYIYVIAIVMLIITRFIGRSANGATRWIYFGPISFQPAELAKLAVILFLPCVIVQIGNRMRGVKAPLIVLVIGGLAALCTYVFTENLSTAIIIAGITAALVFIVHPKTKPFLLIIAITAVVVALIVGFVASTATTGGSFRLKRILVWLDPEAYSSEGGYQVMQGLYAIGSGGFFGKGLGNSTQKLGAVPEAQNDMIFSIICEELGVFGAAIVVLLFVFLLYRLFFIAQNAPDLLGSLIAAGIFVHIALQVILNIAVVINLIPTTGITLPFVSYGGTSIVFLMAEMTLALSISKQIEFR